MKGIRSFSIIMVVIVTVIISIGYHLVDNNKERYLAELNSNLAENNTQYSDFIKSNIKDIMVLVESHGKVLSIKGVISSSELADVFKLVNEKSGAVSSMYFIYGSDGRGVNATGYLDVNDIGMDLRQRPWYINAIRSTGITFAEVYNDFRKDVSMLTISYAVRSGDQLLGVLAADVSLKRLYEHLRNITTWKNTYTYVLDSKGEIVLHPNKDLLGLSIANATKDHLKKLGIAKEHFDNNFIRVWKDDYTKSDKGFVDYLDFTNQKVHAVYEHIPGLDWTVVSAYGYSEIANATFGFGLSAIFVSLLLIIFLGAILYYFLVWSDSRDPVTGTLTTGKMQELINKRKGEKRLLVLFIEPRNLSDINRRYGIKKGEEVLLYFSQAIQYFVKKQGILATTKNRNFIFVFNDNDWNTAVEFTSMLDKQLGKLLLSVEKQSFEIESFIGLTSFPLNEGRKFEEEFASGEELLMEYKKAGIESPLIGFDFKKLLEEKHEEVVLKDELLRAIEEDRIIPFFQPIYDIKTGKANKFEVLMRIKQGDKYLAPFQYIQIAELFNMIESVDFIVISKALEHKKKMDTNDEIELSANISGLVLHDYKFLNKIVKKVDELDIKHSNITFEITETQDALDSSETIEVIRYFKALGFKFSMDDFGTGFSSLYSLKHLPCNYVKIDGAFIKDLEIGNESYYLVEAIISVAKAFKIKTIAEFVENQKINDILKQMGVDYGQGYYFGKPEEDFNFH